MKTLIEKVVTYPDGSTGEIVKSELGGHFVARKGHHVHFEQVDEGGMVIVPPEGSLQANFNLIQSTRYMEQEDFMGYMNAICGLVDPNPESWEYPNQLVRWVQYALEDRDAKINAYAELLQRVIDYNFHDPNDVVMNTLHQDIRDALKKKVER
jgi:predicted RNA binding protein YcfA (HicA-like mRNA interferase family)